MQEMAQVIFHEIVILNKLQVWPDHKCLVKWGERESLLFGHLIGRSLFFKSEDVNEDVFKSYWYIIPRDINIFELAKINIAPP